MTAASAPRRRTRVLAAVLWLAMLAVLAEGGSRLFWRISFGQGPLDTHGDVRHFYPALYPVLAQAPSRTDSVIDVLLLGGSTIHPDYGAIALNLRERLSAATGHRVRVINLGERGHTSRDDWYKYRALAPVGFDLVVIYDGFNEVRANNVPPELFRDDYSHYAWYQLINDVVGHDALWPFTLPYTGRFLARSIRESAAARAGHPVRVPQDRPDSAWTAYGSAIRTAVPLRQNLEAILDLARGRGEKAVIMTFATWFAPGYSWDAFIARRLDYTQHRTPIELWGRPGNVAAGIAAHNAVITALHRARPEVGFVDMAASIPGGRANFNDVCHLTVAGSERFVDALLPVALATLDPRLTSPGPRP